MTVDRPVEESGDPTDGRREPIPRSTFMQRIGLGALAGMIASGGFPSPLKALAAGKPATVAGKIGVWLGNVKNAKPNQYFTYTDPKSGDPAVLIRLASGQFVSYDSVCTHAGCTVPYDPTRRLLVCPCHGARYDPARGAAVVAGPAPQPLARLPIRVDAAGNVYALSAHAAPGAPRTNRLKPGRPGSTSTGDENDDGSDEDSGHGRRHKGDN